MDVFFKSRTFPNITIPNNPEHCRTDQVATFGVVRAAPRVVREVPAADMTSWVLAKTRLPCEGLYRPLMINNKGVIIVSVIFSRFVFLAIFSLDIYSAICVMDPMYTILYFNFMDRLISDW